MTQLDKRTNAFRNDLAASALKGQVNAERFVDPCVMYVSVASLCLRGCPDLTASQTSELLFGQQVHVFELEGKWAWLQSCEDEYVGYALVEGLTKHCAAATHHITTTLAPVFSLPNLKSPLYQPINRLGLNSKLIIDRYEGDFANLHQGGWIYNKHLSPLAETQASPLEVAKAFIGSPYVWGGNGYWGLDCSGLVQLSMLACGIPAPRDADMQEACLGTDIINWESPDNRKAGDLIFWKGHVGLLADNNKVLHSNASAMKVTLDDFDELRASILEKEGNDISRIKRLNLGD